MKSGAKQWRSSEDHSDAWTAGHAPQLAAVVWLGGDEPGPIRTLDGTPITGHNLPAEIWREFLTEALAGMPAADFPPPRKPLGPPGKPGGPAAPPTAPDDAPDDDPALRTPNDPAGPAKPVPPSTVPKRT